MASFTRYEEIEAWKSAREMVGEIGRLIRASRQLERNYALRDQLLRAAVSVMSNVAEGFGRSTDRDFAHFLDIARGSAFETQSLLYVLQDLGFLSGEEFERLYGLADRTAVLITRLARYLRRTSPSSSGHISEPSDFDDLSDSSTY